ncbi:uncharacterized protein [Littorina saxatilis]|uniref:Galaxin-like repeats domain-containing protein n=1 Tax=Littorina saxatilis TaxID=31220 RepID=A0AAN9GBV8_9CAEN
MGTPTTTLLLLSFCLSALTMAQQVENPLLIQAANHRAQEKAKIELQHIQQEQIHTLSRLPDKVPRPKPHHPPHKPLHPQHAQHGGQNGKGQRSNQGGILNRNEMHKGRSHGGPGPTPWTRWTPRPRYQKSPWANHKKTGDNICGGRRYSARDHICCQNTLQKRQGLRPACCGTLSFDFVFSLCCNDKLTPRTAGRPFC